MAANVLQVSSHKQLDKVKSTFKCNARPGTYFFCGIVVTVEGDGKAHVGYTGHRLQCGNRTVDLINSRLEEGMLGLLQDSLRAEIVRGIASSGRALDRRGQYDAEALLTSAFPKLSPLAQSVVGNRVLSGNTAVPLTLEKEAPEYTEEEVGATLRAYRSGECPYHGGVSLFGSAPSAETEMDEFITGVDTQFLSNNETVGSTAVGADGRLYRIIGQPPIAHAEELKVVAVANGPKYDYIA